MFHIWTYTLFILSMIIHYHGIISARFLSKKYVECGQYGFSCEGSNKLRLCEGDRLFGPAFNCPSNSICNEDSSDVCDNTANYIDPTLSRSLRCSRYERVVDTSVPGCKGYILCIPNKHRFQGIKFKCSGNTIFNGLTRTCSAPDKYKCPLADSPLTSDFVGRIDKLSVNRDISGDQLYPTNSDRPIDCKNYKFAVTQDKSLVRATYFCPSRPVNGEPKIRCTIFSNQFCITLERDDPDQFIERAGAAFRRPRIFNTTDITRLQN